MEKSMQFWFIPRVWAALGDGTSGSHNQAEDRPNTSQPIMALTAKSLSEWHAYLLGPDWLTRSHSSAVHIRDIERHSYKISLCSVNHSTLS